MADTQIGSAIPSGRRSFVLGLITALAVASGIVALVLAWRGWTFEAPKAELPWMRWIDIAIRTIKVLLLSDIYYSEFKNGGAQALEIARAFGVIASILFGVRLLVYAVGSRLNAMWFSLWTWGHDVVIGSGPAAAEYAANHSALFKQRRAIHLTAERASTTPRMATFERRGNLKAQLDRSRAGRARRIVIDEGDDAETWQTAQLVAARCPGAEVLAHITDPWMRDRLSREIPKAGLVPFSYAGGAARHVMLAHPPYLFAKKYDAPKLHILMVGFGQVGQSLAREFIVTSVCPGKALMVTVIDPYASRLETDFRSRHPDLCKPLPVEGAASQDDDSHVDFKFIEGDFRLSNPTLFEAIRQRNAEAAISAAYVAIDDDHRPLGMALAIRAIAAQEELFRSPIFICAQHGAGLPSVRQGTGRAGEGETSDDRMDAEKLAEQEGRLCDLRVVSFGSWPEAFDGAGLLEPDYDGQAKRFHESYERLAAEEARNEDPNVLLPKPEPWKVLQDQLRVSNRRAAAHVRAKAFASGYNLEGWLNDQKGGWRTHDLPPAAERLPEQDGDLMKTLVELEHRRWMLDKYLDGWRLGEKRDNYTRRRTDLIPFKARTGKSVRKDYAVIYTTRLLLEEGARSGRQRRR